MKKTPFYQFIISCGGFDLVAKQLGLTKRALYKWSQNNSLPRTEYTLETSHTQTLAQLSNRSADEIKAMFRPKPKSNA